MNAAVEEADGEVVAWINSDDYYADDRVLRRMLIEFERSEDVDIVYGDGAMVDTSGALICHVPGRSVEPRKRVVLYPVPFVLQPALLFRRRLFLEVGGLDPSVHLAPDYDLWLRMMPRAREVVYRNELVALATAHEGGKTVRFLGRQFLESYRLKQRHRRLYSLTLVDRIVILRGHLKNLVYWLLVRCGAYSLLRSRRRR